MAEQNGRPLGDIFDPPEDMISIMHKSAIIRVPCDADGIAVSRFYLTVLSGRLNHRSKGKNQHSGSKPGTGKNAPPPIATANEHLLEPVDDAHLSRPPQAPITPSSEAPVSRAAEPTRPQEAAPDKWKSSPVHTAYIQAAVDELVNREVDGVLPRGSIVAVARERDIGISTLHFNYHARKDRRRRATPVVLEGMAAGEKSATIAPVMADALVLAPLNDHPCWACTHFVTSSAGKGDCMASGSPAEVGINAHCGDFVLCADVEARRPHE